MNYTSEEFMEMVAKASEYKAQRDELLEAMLSKSSWKR